MPSLIAMGLLALLVGCGEADKNHQVDANNSSASRQIAKSVEELGYKSFAEGILSRDLADAGNAPMKFVELASAQTGIDFENRLDKKSHMKLIETGAGVAIADYDGDGLADIYLLSTDGPNRLFRQTSPLKFEDATDQAGVPGTVDGENAWGAGASFADVDNDGDLDLFVCNMASRDLLYINQGDGTFSENGVAAGVAFEGASKIGSFCDYDCDGDLDCYLLTYQDFEPEASKAKIRMVNGEPTVHPDFVGQYEIVAGRIISAGDPDILYQNNGDGTFTNVSNAAGIEGYDLGLSVTWWDYNNDNWPDVYVGNDFKGADRLYKNNGDGTFTNTLADVVSHTPWFSMGADAGDLNNDGLEDFMIADMSGSTHYKQKTNMGEMGASAWFLNHGRPRQYMRNALYVNTGRDRFMEAAYMVGLDSTDWTWSVKFGDLDNDGLSDIFVTNGNARNTGDSDFKAKFDKLSAELSKDEVDAVMSSTPPLNEMNRAFKNNGNFDFEPIESVWNLDKLGVSHGAAFSDLDNDGDLDIVVNNLSEPASIYRNDGGAGNRIKVRLQGTKSNRFGYGSKVQIWQNGQLQTRRLFPVRGYISSDEPIVQFGTGDSKTIEKLIVTWPDGGQQTFENLSTGKEYLIQEAEKTLPSPSEEIQTMFVNKTLDAGFERTHAEEKFDDYDREPLLPYQLSQLGPGISWGDVNNDGQPDAYVGGASFQEGALLINDQGKFTRDTSSFIQDLQSEDMGALFFDANGDGFDDLYVVSGSNEFDAGNNRMQDRLYMNDGSGNFKKSKLPEHLDSGSCVCACDFDRDGDLDLFVGTRSIPGKYPLTPESRLLRNEGGKFIDVASDVANGLDKVGLVNAALWTDFDQDGWVDLLIALDWGPVTLFRNVEGKFENVTETVGLADKLGWWHGLASGDFDHDGDIDYVVTNQGLNTKYHCNKTHPHRLYYSDFDNSGTLDLVEAEFENDTEFPVRGRSCSSHCMPFIKDKFETYHDFAMAPLEDIYTSEIKNRPFHQVTELQSMVIWNDGVEGLRMSPLPRLAQISPSFGVVARDFNNDGNLDIMLAQNFFGSQPETGFQDGGVSLLLCGNGKGNFESVWPAESGIVVPHDATSVSAADIDHDGDLDCAFATNNGPIQYYENKTDDSAGFVSITLEGPQGNSRAIGSTVVVDGDAGKQAFQVTAGSGYLGQSPTALRYKGNLASILVRWPDGTKAQITEPDNKKTIVVKHTAR